TFNVTDFIISYNPSSTDIFPAYQDRISYVSSTVSLELRDLTLKDVGEYSVNVVPNGGGRINLDIYEKISGVSIKASTEQIIEGSSVTLTCEASGSSPSRTWKKDGSDLNLSENVTLSEDNTVLTFKAVKKENSGEYVCLVSNPISSISDPVNILVNGPENTKMSASPSQEFYEEGSDISLSCSADSRPSAQFTWFVNGTKLPDSGPELTLRNIQFSQRGDYSCQAFNSRTLTSEMSPSLSISVLHTKTLPVLSLFILWLTAKSAE
uniref:Carcinoembryonic antigen-related cell adhesion molecule 1-like n=1 Tax=Oryzias melastigma TaxID=30732 RepID=A0A3B3C9J8_ORYME